jgi:hypothetical protein
MLAITASLPLFRQKIPAGSANLRRRKAEAGQGLRETRMIYGLILVRQGARDHTLPPEHDGLVRQLKAWVGMKDLEKVATVFLI